MAAAAEVLLRLSPVGVVHERLNDFLELLVCQRVKPHQVVLVDLACITAAVFVSDSSLALSGGACLGRQRI